MRIMKSMGIVMAPATVAAANVVPFPAPAYDAGKPTDVLGPYALFAESGTYNVYAVASSRSARTLTGGLDVVPQLSFSELAARLNGDPDIVVVPQIVDIRFAQNESGAIDGKTVTEHSGPISTGSRPRTPKCAGSGGVRYVDGGPLLSTAGLTAGADATLHLSSC
jgi:AraC family transcriptional activator FtrA